MRLLPFAAVVLIVAASQPVFGQNDFQMIQNMVQQQQNSFDGMLRQQRQRQAQINLNFRRAKGDFTSTDAQIEAELSSRARVSNPNAFAQIHNNAIASNAATFQQSQSNWGNYVDATQQRIRKSDQLTSATNTWIGNRRTENWRGESRFVNPETGGVSVLPYYQPNRFRQGTQSQTYFQTDWGRYRSMSPEHYPTDLNPYHGW